MPSLCIKSKFINRFLPLKRINVDPLLPVKTNNQRYIPVTISRMRVTPLVKSIILSKRKVVSFKLEQDKRLTLIIPYRNRQPHLDLLLPQLYKAFKDQGVTATILVVEQGNDKSFNRGKLLNIGAQHAWDNSDYFCFHDVDMIPSVSTYQSPNQPLRLVKQLSYSHRNKVCFKGSYFGGSCSILKHQFEACNGFSNMYWGWGKEDDDFLMRLLLTGFVPHEDLQSLYDDLDTPIEEKKTNKATLLKGNNKKLKNSMFRNQSDYLNDGLSNLKYELLDQQMLDGYQKIIVDI